MNLEELRAYMLRYLPGEFTNKRRMETIGTDRLGNRNYTACSNKQYNRWDWYDNRRNDVALQRHWRYTPHAYHTHEYVEILYMYIGTGENITESESIRLNEGDLCVITPGAWHLPYIDGDSVLVNFIVRASYLEKFMSGIKSDGAIAAYFKSINQGSHYKYLHIRCGSDAKIVTAASMLLLSLTENDWEDSCAENTGYFELLLLQLFKSGDGMAFHSASKFADNALSMRIHQIIASDYRTLTLDRLAQQLGYSKAHICRVIRTSNDSTFSDIVNRLRVEEACRLLENTDSDLATISQTCGFASVEYFSRVFKKYSLLSPGEYRRRSARRALKQP